MKKFVCTVQNGSTVYCPNTLFHALSLSPQTLAKVAESLLLTVTQKVLAGAHVDFSYT